MQCVIGTMFYVSAHLVANNTFDGELNNILFNVIIWTGWNAGNNLFFSSSLSEGIQAAKNILKIIDEKSEDEINRSKFGQSFLE